MLHWRMLKTSLNPRFTKSEKRYERCKTASLCGCMRSFLYRILFAFDFYAGEAVGKYAGEISSGNSKLTSNEKVTMDSLSLENQIGG